MVRAETGVDERELLGFRIIHADMTPGSFEREQLRRWMVRAFLAEGRIGWRTNSGRDPDPPLFIEHRIMNGGLTLPNPFRSPVRRRREH